MGHVLDTAKHRRLAAWIAANIMPHEAAVRAWLSKSLVTKSDIDDLIQEAYCRLAALSNHEQISRPDGYFFQIVRNLLNEQLRRSYQIRIDASIIIEALPHDDEDPSPERIVSARQEWDRVQALLETLPERCRLILKLRKIDGLSQRAIAQKLGITESIVENDAIKGIRLIMEGICETPKPKDKKQKARGHEAVKNRS